MEPKITRIGKYEIMGTLGKGAMGFVYQGFDPMIRRHVAIKTMSMTDGDQAFDQIRLRFQREAQAAGNLIKGEGVDHRTDLFSVGVILYEMLTGQKAFSGSTMSSVIYKVVHEELPSPSQIQANVPAGLDKAVARAVAKDRNYRCDSADAFAAALDQTRSESEQTPLPPPLPEPKPTVPETAALKVKKPIKQEHAQPAPSTMAPPARAASKPPPETPQPAPPQETVVQNPPVKPAKEPEMVLCSNAPSAPGMTH